MCKSNFYRMELCVTQVEVRNTLNVIYGIYLEYDPQGTFIHMLVVFLVKTLPTPINQGQTSELPGSRRYNYYGCPNITMKL